MNSAVDPDLVVRQLGLQVKKMGLELSSLQTPFHELGEGFQKGVK